MRFSARERTAGKISSARMSQILGLRNLAPAIKEKVLFLPQRVIGRERITEERMRGIAQVVDWEELEKLFAPLVAGEAARELTHHGCPRSFDSGLRQGRPSGRNWHHLEALKLRYGHVGCEADVGRRRPLGRRHSGG